MTTQQQQRLIEISSVFGVQDTEGFYLSVVAIANVLIASIEYRLITKTWRRYREKRKPHRLS